MVHIWGLQGLLRNERIEPPVTDRDEHSHAVSRNGSFWFSLSSYPGIRQGWEANNVKGWFDLSGSGPDQRDIACTGHTATQAPQSTQTAGSTTDFPSTMVNAPTGHVPTQAPHPMQVSLSIFTAMITPRCGSRKGPVPLSDILIKTLLVTDSL